MNRFLPLAEQQQQQQVTSVTKKHDNSYTPRLFADTFRSDVACHCPPPPPEQT